ncbi:MAG: 16S rRNA (adenine(1518)-N(6)/adenine(1519)-N(6))-dimethyltransferase RsmA [Cyclobacteriaceae bacterium]|nr:MAG: 16S rRNA (adenine(1518)-N(6)/adenine(1519)-N(6))-dimethyltransferase RsmA [Cyclobacteriaceae bacterium]
MLNKSASPVRPKKSLGQHFLHDKNIAGKIVESLKFTVEQEAVLEVGPGMGVLTHFLIEQSRCNLKVIEIDRDSVSYLKTHYPRLSIIEGDFLEADFSTIFSGKFSIIGNFPYNISSQILFKVYEHRDQVWQVVGMLQKEVADRIAAPPGSKTYGILSVLLQAYYRIDYLFKVAPGVFIPPPKVMSAVVRLERNERAQLPCDEQLFKQVVKQGFNNRRKTLRNALKNLILAALQAQPEGAVKIFLAHELLDKRAEQLTVEDFIYLTQLIEKHRGGVGTV